MKCTHKKEVVPACPSVLFISQTIRRISIKFITEGLIYINLILVSISSLSQQFGYNTFVSENRDAQLQQNALKPTACSTSQRRELKHRFPFLLIIQYYTHHDKNIAGVRLLSNLTSTKFQNPSVSLFPVPPTLEQTASGKRFVSLEFLNPIHSQ
jgi:hypothetical protein